MYNFSSKLSFLFIVLISLKTYSQCTETGTNFGNNTSTPSYNVSSDVSATLNTDSTVIVDLANNFSTASGSDVRAYLVNSNGLSDTVLEGMKINNIENIDLGLVSCSGCTPIVSPNGEKSFTVVAISSFHKIFFYCFNFNAFWDIGSFNPFTSDSCSVLSIEENSFTNVDVFPNPVSTNIQLSNLDFDNTEICIFDFSEKKVFQQLKGNIQNTIGVSNLKTGLYVLSVTENNKQFSQKLVIQ